MKALFILLALSLSGIFFFSHEEIPTLYIQKSDGFRWKEKAPCSVIYAHSDTLSGAIKWRGGFSSKYQKHSFSLELDKKFSFTNLPKDDDWIINANYIDKTFMRHKISYDLFREMNDKNIASRCSYINLLINDQYNGLYVLMEEINGGMVGLKKTDSLAMIFKDPPVFREEKLSFVQDPSNYYQQKFPKIHIADKTSYIQQFREFLFDSSDLEFSQKFQIG